MLLNIAIVPLIAALVGSVVAAPARMGGDLMVRAAASNSSSTSSNNTSTSASGSKTAAAAKKHAAGKTQNFTIDDFDVVANVQPVDPKNPDGGVNCGLLVTAGDPDLVYTPGVVGTDLVYSPPKRSLGKRTKTFSTSAAGFDLVANLNPSVPL
ncbi:hypothetical protein C8R46DRAFT_369657 [Mycena filopes]|nr:hypothetical protein C8R46DRAFT_369657 [Mycena filopes]